MVCSNCSTSKKQVPKGCKNNGGCTAKSCGIGSKLAVFDWLSNMTLPTGQTPFDIYEISFKNGRKHFYKNKENLNISIGDIVVVQETYGYGVGIVSLTGELVKVQMRKRKIDYNNLVVNKIYRKATQKDIDIWQKARQKEIETQRRAREIINQLGLKMKLSDVEYQGDNTKAIFYYTADERVDFRQLIRSLASAFLIRIEMKQVGMRQEATRLGGVGSCGRELCCSTWLTDFRKVNTIAAKYQQLSLNPLKLAGQCGKLKCCLNFELDLYIDALKEFPNQEEVLKTEKGDAVFVKMDIFKKLIWYTYKEKSHIWYKLSLEQVLEIIELNTLGEQASPLEEYESEIEEQKQQLSKTLNFDFENVVGQDSITRFDKPKKPRRNIKKSGKSNFNTKANIKINNKNQQQNTQGNNTSNKMQKTTNKNKLYTVFFALTFFFISCDKKRVFDQYITLPNQKWNKNNQLNFVFSINDTVKKHNLFLTLRNNKEYLFSNLFVITKMDFPDGNSITDTLEYDMADASGKFLGKGFFDIKENKLFYKENIVFPLKGAYTFKVRQSMRKNGEINGIENLQGLTDIGFRIEKTKR